MKIKAIITGSTGMVGEGVLHECLLHPDVIRSGHQQADVQRAAPKIEGDPASGFY